MSKNVKIIIAFVAGQVVQIILNILSASNYMKFPILFCGAAGFLILAAVVAGMYLATQEEISRPKTYQDYAEAGR